MGLSNWTIQNICVNINNFQDKHYGVSRNQSGAIHLSCHPQLLNLQNFEKERKTVAQDSHSSQER